MNQNRTANVPGGAIFAPEDQAATPSGETWRFEIRDASADQVFLVKDCEGGPSSWLAMNRVDQGQWQVTTTFGPGSYRLRYFRAEGSTFFNCGTAGLVGRRIAGRDPSVTVESLAVCEAV